MMKIGVERWKDGRNKCVQVVKLRNRNKAHINKTTIFFYPIIHPFFNLLNTLSSLLSSLFLISLTLFQFAHQKLPYIFLLLFSLIHSQFSPNSPSFRFLRSTPSLAPSTSTFPPSPPNISYIISSIQMVCYLHFPKSVESSRSKFFLEFFNSQKTHLCLKKLTKVYFDFWVLSRGLFLEIQQIKNSWMSLRKGKQDLAHQGQYEYEELPKLSKNYYQYIFINVVHASNKSDMHLVISRRKIHPETSTLPSRQTNNPYVFKPKSYSSKRHLHQEIGQKNLRLSPTKKVKKQKEVSKQISATFAYSLDQITKQTELKSTDYFHNSFFSKNKMDDQKNSSTILGNETGLQKKMNPMIKSEITIVSNRNEKHQALIHEGLLLSNTTHPEISKEQHFLKSISNPFDIEKRDYYLKTIKFEKEYKSGYIPIEMQMKNQDQNEEGTNYEGSKTHFIRKKQSTLSLPRACGVSYVKPSQSTQSAPFQPLPPLIYQCASKPGEINKSKEKFQSISNIFCKYTENCWIPFIYSNEDQMRYLLLGKRVGKVGWIKGVQNLWPFFTEGSFFLLIYSEVECYTQEDVWRAYERSVFKVGILAKRSTSGKKSFLKSLNITLPNKKQVDAEEEDKNEENVIMIDLEKQLSLQETLTEQLKDCRTVVTLSLRLEMYVEEKQWKTSTKETKFLLNYLITDLKDRLQKNTLDLIKKRINLKNLEKNIRDKTVQKTLQNIRFIHDEDEMGIQESVVSLNNSTDEQSLMQMLKRLVETSDLCEKRLINKTKRISIEYLFDLMKSESIWQKNLKMPLYFISTRDSFAFDLVEKVSFMEKNGRRFKKIEYFFQSDNLPTNYGRQYRQRFPDLNVGITCYHDFFTNEEMLSFQNKIFDTEVNAFKNKFLQMTVQPNIVGTRVKRTKFFFGYRYMWTRCQIAQPGSNIAAGVRKDVTSPPKWVHTIINQFVNTSIAEKDFINSIAINVYHDGKQGLAQHFDDAVRFKQPIYTLRLFSDARLSFGSQFYGFCNGAFIIPLPRGCICVMEENSYAANGVKHCVRPIDMTGKSAALILRQMHHKVVSEATKYDQLIDFPSWISTMSSDPESVTFAQQKRRQSEYILCCKEK